ncbi:Chorismate mutase I / Prephenate dehydratase [Thioalkalivibrio nitratireducens DSM 14787]|uniref:Bifunctional chorismate mutase/prephenate dehydratase n=1 Tax=Thioalkalivibrio nitratireducens (strain DSM 14787 / UNIQEM 213 / ALEN2) TaxID=1255043 RepID=L0DWU1_THIND|nr:Chorismate mutase I / Prephenate dehydratase [Thioalkalivibrio nitratireducens DSM 14787]
MSGSDELERVRERIDWIDADLLRLLNERARCAEDVAAVKRGQGNPVFYRPEREAVILRQVRERNPGPLPGDAVVRLFREIMSECLALEQPLQVAYLGPEGTFTHLATRKHFGHAATLLPLASIDSVFREVASGRVQFGVVPIENSTEGVVSHTVDCFLESPVLICGEVVLPVQHHLLSSSARLEDVRLVMAHPQALAQCRQWLDRRLPGVERRHAPSNARAADDAAGVPGAAVIASEVAAERYGLEILARNIEDRGDNTTRFLVIGRIETDPTGRDRTSIMLSTANRPGSLFRLLKPIAEAGISLTRIESRPSRCVNWEYVFFLDLIGHQQDPAIAACLEELRESAEMLKILGSYPQAAT